MGMKLSRGKVFVILALLICIIFTYRNKHEAYSRGDGLYLDGERYDVTSACLYRESNKKICKTDDGCIVYEVEGDKEHNYVVCRCLWDAQLLVKKSYVPDETIVSAVCFGRNRDNYIYDKDIISCVLSLADNKEFIDDSDEFMDTQNKRTDIYMKYGEEAVGKYIGEIFLHQNRYMYCSYNEQIVTILTDEQIELLQEYL